MPTKDHFSSIKFLSRRFQCDHYQNMHNLNKLTERKKINRKPEIISFATEICRPFGSMIPVRCVLSLCNFRTSGIITCTLILCIFVGLLFITMTWKSIECKTPYIIYVQIFELAVKMRKYLHCP